MMQIRPRRHNNGKRRTMANSNKTRYDEDSIKKQLQEEEREIEEAEKHQIRLEFSTNVIAAHKYCLRNIIYTGQGFDCEVIYIPRHRTVKNLDLSIFLMALKNNKWSIAAALALTLLSVSMASLMTIAISHNTSAQELPEGSVAQQGGEQVPGALQPDTGIASLDNTTTEQPGGGVESSPCTPAQTGGAGVQNSTANATITTTTIGGTGSMTNNYNNNNSTALGAVETNPSISQVRDHIEQACIALEVGDIQGALGQLNFALGELGGGSDDIQGNNTATSLREGEEGSFNEGANVGGTGPFDDYDETPDAEAR